MDLITPKLSATMENATIVRWLKKPGDTVRGGEPLVEVETDKATVEIEAPADSVLEVILVEEGAEVEVGAPLARLRPIDSGEDTTLAAKEPGPSSSAAKGASYVVPVSGGETRRRGSNAKRVLASPLARRLATDAGIDIKTLHGSGPKGRIQKVDVPTKAIPKPEESCAKSISSKERIESPSPMRLRIADAVSTSRQSIPSFSLDRWVTTTRLQARRAELDEAATGGVKPTIIDFMLLEITRGLLRHPAMWARWTESDVGPSVTIPGHVSIGIVVAVDDGILIPTLSHLDQLTVEEIVQLRHDIVHRARTGKLTSADFAPASISLSALNRGGADRFEAIISPGQSSILAVGREHERPVASDGGIKILTGFNLTLSADHRLIDGLLGATFLGTLADLIEQEPA